MAAILHHNNLPYCSSAAVNEEIRGHARLCSSLNQDQTIKSRHDTLPSVANNHPNYPELHLQPALANWKLLVLVAHGLETQGKRLTHCCCEEDRNRNLKSTRTLEHHHCKWMSHCILVYKKKKKTDRYGRSRHQQGAGVHMRGINEIQILWRWIRSESVA